MFISDFHSDLLSGGMSLAECDNFLANMDFSSMCLACYVEHDASDHKSLIQKYFSLKNRSGIYMCLENLAYVDNENINDIIALRPLYASLTWNHENRLAGGAMTDCGLKKFGSDIVKKLQDNKIIIDCAHLSRESFFDLADINRYILVNSHTCLNRFYSHRRNIDDEQIKLILDSGGIIGLTFVENFLNCDKNTVADKLLCQIEYFINTYPYTKLSIGSDIFGSENIKNYEIYYKLVEKLLKIGYNECIVDSIINRNLTEFIDSVY